MQGISKAFLLPVLALIIAQFPFELAGFHSDNGSEYINAQVARMLNKLNIEQTKSRSRHSNDLRPGREQECQRGQEAHGLQPYPAEVCKTHQCVLPGDVQRLARM